MKLKYTILLGITLFLVTFTNTSCNDVNDWQTDNSYARLLRTASIEIIPNTFTADISWTAIPKAEYYIIEISKEELTDEIEMGNTTSSIIFGQDKSITSSSYTMTNLESSTKYYIRIKALSSTTAESKWAYNGETNASNFMTTDEQIFLSISQWDIDEEEVTVRWEANSEVTSLLLNKPDGSTDEVILEAESIANGEYTFTELEKGTTYTINIYNGTKNRGKMTFTTDGHQGEEVEEIPNSYSRITLSEDLSIYDIFAEPAKYTDNPKKIAIIIPAGMNIEISGKLTKIPAEMQNILFWGEDGTKQASITINEWLTFATREDKNGIGTIKFHNLSITGRNETEGYTSDYIFNQSEEKINISTISFVDCNLSHLRGVIRFQKSAQGSSIGTLKIKGTQIYHINGYGILTLFDKASPGFVSIANISIENSTIYDINTTMFSIGNTSASVNINIANCTLYKRSDMAGKYIADSNTNTNCKPSICIFTNTILGQASTTESKSKFTRGSAEVSDMNNFYYYSSSSTVLDFSKKDFVKIDANNINLWSNPDEGDFTIVDLSQLTKGPAGDPRWYTIE